MSGPPGEPPVNPLSDPEFVAGLRPVPTGTPGEAPAWPAVDLHGVRPDGTPVSLVLDDCDRPVLLVFLAVDCDGCESFWRGLAGGSPDDAVVPVVVTRGPGSVDPTTVAACADGVDATVVMSDDAWEDLRVTGYPFLVLVDPRARRVLAEAVGFGWDDAVSLVARTLGR
jgi:hypothetical protein